MCYTCCFPQTSQVGLTCWSVSAADLSRRSKEDYDEEAAAQFLDGVLLIPGLLDDQVMGA